MVVWTSSGPWIQSSWQEEGAFDLVPLHRNLDAKLKGAGLSSVHKDNLSVAVDEVTNYVDRHCQNGNAWKARAVRPMIMRVGLNGRRLIDVLKTRQWS